ncbi:restriction endonuclease subunit S [Nocardia salmonicida]|uniref:restriction endonuclease subunit S n=1 Tax=Nocardia salmonicida TaxID=53431 RepID=UPI0033E08968
MVPLRDVATLQRGYDLPVQDRTPGEVPVFAANGPVGSHNVPKVDGPGVVTGRSGTIGRVHHVDGAYWPLNTSLYVKDFHGNDSRYVYYLLRQMKLEQYGTGTGVPTLNRNIVHDVEVPVPPIEEQRRIAAILDHADALRAKRREALAHLDELTRSIFIDMFGDPTMNQMGWARATLGEVCGGRFRNGLSPSTSGSVRAKVLTLSAVTGSGFDGSAFKVSTFNATPPAGQSVSSHDLLVCRGNGNLKLVGRGYFAPHALPDVTFPDTIIAATVDPERCDRAFIEQVWGTRIIRAQIESAARTTNGTFKINQTMLSGIEFPLPDLDRQTEFGKRKADIATIKEQHRVALAELDALFSSLQSRAFRGEL